MTEERVAPWIVRQIEGNLWAILAAAGAAYGGYLTGTTTTDHRLAVLEGDVGKLEKRVDEIAPVVVRLEATSDVLMENDREQRKGAE